MKYKNNDKRGNCKTTKKIYKILKQDETKIPDLVMLAQKALRE